MKQRSILRFISIILLLFSGTLLAQSGTAEICVTSFIDANGNGVQDSDESFVSQGITALLSNDNIQVASQSLSSPSGQICFTDLEAGIYQINIISLDYEAQTNRFVEVVEDGDTAEVLYAAQEIGSSSSGLITGAIADNETEPDTSASTDPGIETPQDQRRRALLFASIGTALIVSTLILTGLFLYFAIFRRRLRRHRSAANRYNPPPIERKKRSTVFDLPAVQPGESEGDANAPDPLDSRPLPSVEEQYLAMQKKKEEQSDSVEVPSTVDDNNPYAEDESDEEFPL